MLRISNIRNNFLPFPWLLFSSILFVSYGEPNTCTRARVCVCVCVVLCRSLTVEGLYVGSLTDAKELIDLAGEKLCATFHQRS